MNRFTDIAKIVHSEGYIFIVLSAAATFLLSSFSTNLGWLGFIITCGCIWFFRNPERYTPIQEGIMVSPADGYVKSITRSLPPEDLELGDDEMVKISICLGLLDVHVNRVPIAGKIVDLKYNAGKFFNATLDKASVHNERQSIVIEADKGQKIVCVQIAGIVARRIVCDLEEEEVVKTGQRFGIIRFGSRVDVYLPSNIAPMVCEGQTCVGGETVLADLKSKKLTAPDFEVRK